MAVEAHEPNRRRWDEVTPVHVASRFYDVDGFLARRCMVKPIEREALGDLRGKRLLHLQCHFGLDTLSLARQGAAKVVGIDFSEPALAEARRPFAAWRIFPDMAFRGNTRYWHRPEADERRLPLMYALKARWP